MVERFFNKIKHCRRVATRYDKLAANYLAFIQLASITLWPGVYEYTTLVCVVSLLTTGVAARNTTHYPLYWRRV